MNVLVVAPHPDDDVLGCGGVIARRAAQGDEVHVLVMSRGAPDIFPPEQVERTRAELRRAHRILGVSDATFLDFPAPRLDTVPGHELADAIARVISDIRPEVMYLPYGGDLHVDHRAAHLAGLVAARPVNGCSIRRILCYETLSETEWAGPDAPFAPTVFADITDYLEVKIKALSCIPSQLKPPPNSRSLEVARAIARFRGGTAGLAAAEAFALVREID